MQGLMLKLSNVDAAGERALRVVSYFDQLSVNSPDLEAVARSAAVIADCTAGIELPRRGLLVRCSRDGDPLNGPALTGVCAHSLDLGDEDGSVWLERESEARDLDEFIVERFAMTVGGVLQRERSSGELYTAHGFSDPALAQILISERSTEAERSRAAGLIGIHPSNRVQLIALNPDEGAALPDLVLDLRRTYKRQLFASELSRRLALVILVGSRPVDLGILEVAGRLGVGPVVETLDAPRSWSIARETLRFAGAGVPWPRAIDSGSLGVLRLLSGLDPDVVAADRDVAAIARLAAEPAGEMALTVLDHFLHSGSLREAARATNFHHSSLQSRVTRIGKQLGLDLMSSAGRQRAQLALLLWRTVALR